MPVPRDTSVSRQIIIVRCESVGNCQTLSKDGPSQIVNSIIFRPFVLSLRPMSNISYQFCPVPTCAHHVFCTLFSCLSIDSSLYHAIFSHATVFSVFFIKGKVELGPSVRILITYILINCEWFIIKLCGIGIILLTDLLSGITSYCFSIDLRFDCIFNHRPNQQYLTFPMQL